MAFKLKKRSPRVYVLIGDGECDCGQIWEAAMSAGHYKLDNLCAILDYNKLQIDGTVEEVMGLSPLADKWKDFSWNVIEVDGHDIDQILDGYEKAKSHKSGPSVIIGHTEKGKGVSFMEGKCSWHGKSPDKKQLEFALKELSDE